MIKTNELNALAYSFGIDFIGAADLCVLDNFRIYLRKYENEPIAFFRGGVYDKIDIKRAWASAVGALAFGVSYKNNAKRPNDGQVRGIIAACARGRDYHFVLREAAEALMQELIVRGYYIGEYQINVDTGVLSDRALAYSAGLGFYGKNNFLINPRYGSFVFLGHILLSAPLVDEYLPLMESVCGDCRRCLDGCPKRAYTASGVLDYNRCISYLTQKGRGEDTNGYVYGCDICQNVCPLNKAVPESRNSAFSCADEYAFPKLAELSEISDERFSAVYGQSSLSWRGAKNLRKVSKKMLEK